MTITNKPLKTIFATLSFTITSIGYTNTSPSVFEFHRITQVIASPDSTQVAYTSMYARQTPQGRKWEYQLNLADKNGRRKTLTNTRGIIKHLQWSPDGSHITYINSGKSHQSIWEVSLAHPEPKILIEYHNGDIQNYSWAKNSKAIAFTAANLQPQNLEPINVNTNYINSQLFVTNLKDKNIPPAITPSRYNVTTFDWLPNNQSIVFSHQPKPGDYLINNNKLSIINLATKKISDVAYTNSHTGLYPSASPDGKWIAFTTNLPRSRFATALNNNIKGSKQICITNPTKQEPICLANTLNKNPQPIGWSKDSNEIYVLDADATNGDLIYALNINPKTPAKLISDVKGYIDPLTVTLNAKNETFGFTYETTTDAPEAYIGLAKSFSLTPVSHLNDSIKKLAAKVKAIHWQSTDGLDIEGLITTPANYNHNKKYPLFIAVHGGPDQAWVKRYIGGCNENNGYIEPTSCIGNLLNQGFVVFQPNPRGSNGYGQAYKLANFADLGGGDFQDIISGVDSLIKKGIADPHKIAIGGWSYGGYMSAWAISQTKRFKAAIIGDGGTDFTSLAGTSDHPNYLSMYFGSNFEDNNKLYQQRSPITFAKQINTPLLILSSPQNYSVPISQSLELHTELQEQNKTVKIMLLPNEAYLPNSPEIILSSINEINQWLKKV